MVVTFGEKYLEELYVNGRCSDKKHRFQPHVVKRYQQRVQQLVAAPRAESLYQFGSLRFEALRGDKKGLYSVRVNDQYRIEFSLAADDDSMLLTVCNIVELSNHYD